MFKACLKALVRVQTDDFAAGFGDVMSVIRMTLPVNFVIDSALQTIAESKADFTS